MEPYINNAEIITFIKRAKGKIAALGTASIAKDSKNVELAIELKKVIRSIESHFNDWSEQDVLKAVHYYNHKADLNDIPFFNFPGFNTIRVGGSDASGKVQSSDIVDFEAAVLDAVRKMQHNLLSGIDGPGTYHLTKQEKDFVTDLVNPFNAPTVGIIGSKDSGILYRKGFNMAPVTLTGKINLNQGEEVLSKKFYRDSLLIASGVDSVEYTQPITATTTFKFVAEFKRGGTKEASIIYNLVEPILYGLGNNTPTAILTNKVSSIEIQYSYIDGTKKPYFIVPVFLGDIKSIKISGFEVLTASNWSRTIDSATNGYKYTFLANYNESFKITLGW